MALADRRLTDLEEKLTVPDDAVIHFVDPSDVTQNAAGSSFKAKKSAFVVQGSILTTEKTLVSSALTTQDVAGIVTYINALSPVVVVAVNETVFFRVTDTGQGFLLLLHGVTVGLAQTAITSSNILEFEMDRTTLITITTSVSITTATLDANGLGQNGRHVVIANGASAINLTCNGSVTSSYGKGGTAAITFVQGSGRTLVQLSGTAIMNGIAGSTASLWSVGTIDYLTINNF